MQDGEDELVGYHETKLSEIMRGKKAYKKELVKEGMNKSRGTIKVRADSKADCNDVIDILVKCKVEPLVSWFSCGDYEHPYLMIERFLEIP